MTSEYILFPGRHHLLTCFQAQHLAKLGGTIVWAVTSANHENTKRNPVPYHRREAAIERFSVEAGLRSLVVPIFDTAPTELFAEVTLKNIAVATGLELTPDDTLVACSTPAVAELYTRLGFAIDLVEAGEETVPERPWDVLLRLAESDESWRELAHPATIDVFERYRLVETVRSVMNDPVVGDEGGLTATRDYRTYAEAFADSAQRKWKLVKEHVRPGRIVDIGCGAGAVLEMADREPALRESDLIGVEIARHLYEECVHKKAQGIFSNANVYFYRRNVLGGAVFPDRSIDTTLTFALTHEIWSYGEQLASVRAFAQAIYDHTAPGGVWVNSDVCGPDGRDKMVRLKLRTDDGADSAADVAELSTRARFDQFVADYRFPFEHRADGDTITLRLADAMDYLTRKDYTDNWLSETQEQFCGLEFADWKQLLTDIGFEIDPASRTTRNDWIIDNRIKPVAELADERGNPLDWPVTHIFFVARRPLNT